MQSRTLYPLSNLVKLTCKEHDFVDRINKQTKKKRRKKNNKEKKIKIIESWILQYQQQRMLTCKDWGRKLGRGAPPPHHLLNLWVQMEDQHLLRQDPPMGVAACMAGAGVTPPGETHFLLVNIL